MSLKLLFDCVVTARHPASCSSNMQLLHFAARILAETDDVYIRWLVPDWVSEEVFKETYPQDPRVEYRRVPQHYDRVLGYIQPPQELLRAVFFKGDFWDTDIVVTMRSGLVPLLRMNMNSPKRRTQGWLQRVILLENMPIMKFKDTVPNANEEVSDLWTLAGYLAADKVYVPSFHEKQSILRAATANLPPSKARGLDAKIKEVLISRRTERKLKTKKQFPAPDKGKPFCIAYCNRMEKGFRIDDVNKIMTNKWIMNGSKVRLLVTTVSTGVKAFDTDLVEIKQANPTQFWKLIDEMHVGLFIPKQAALSMTLVELMMAGVPMVITRFDWLEKMFPGYPLFVGNDTEAYALVSMFMDDYPGMYAKWRAWIEAVFYPLMDDLVSNSLLYDHLMRDLAEFDQVLDRFKEASATLAENELVQMIVEHVADRDEFRLHDVLLEFKQQKKTDNDLYDIVYDPKTRDDKSLIFSMHLNPYRLALKCFHGWEDASVEAGHFRRSSS